MQKIFKKLSLPFWNIGFTKQSIGNFVNNEFTLDKIYWLDHPYKDRFFADPFILDVKEKTIEVLVEELLFIKGKGTIVKLTVDKNSFKLISRKEILSLSTHLSYPAIYRLDGEVYVYPESGESGKLTVYKYNIAEESVTPYKEIINRNLGDSTILPYQNTYWLFATSGDNEKLKVHFSENQFSDYKEVSNNPVVTDKSRARPAGNFFKYDDIVYRPSQICENSYGEGICINKVDFISNAKYSETVIKKIYPKDNIYSFGMHTINFHQSFCVIDGLKMKFNPFVKLIAIFKSIISGSKRN